MKEFLEWLIHTLTFWTQILVWMGKPNLFSASLYCDNQDKHAFLSAVHWIESWHALKISSFQVERWLPGPENMEKLSDKGHFPRTCCCGRELSSQKSDGLILVSSISLCQRDYTFSFSHCHFNWAHWHSSETLISTQSINFQQNRQLTT